MTDHKKTIRLIVVTTAGDVDKEFQLQQPLQVVFNDALREVGGEANRDQFVLEYNDSALTDLHRHIAEFAAELNWSDGTTLDLVPTPVVV